MSDLARQQCFHHPGRQAMVRCPSCHRDYCRECVTEHEDRYLCSNCLRRDAEKSAKKRSPMRVPVGLLMALAGVLTAWTVYYVSVELLALKSAGDESYRVWHAR